MYLNMQRWLPFANTAMTPIDSLRQQTLSDLYHAHHGWLISLLRRKLGRDGDAAADLAQDAFLRLMRIDLAPVLAAPRSYLTVVADNLIVSRHRRARLERAYLEALAAQPDQYAPSVETRCIVLETLEALCNMVESFDPRTRRIFLLAQLEGLSYPEIAERLGVHLSAVKRDMSKAYLQCYRIAYGI